MMGEGGGETRPIVFRVEPQAGAEDQAELESDEPDAARGGDGLDAGAQMGGVILGAVEQHRAAVADREATECRSAARDTDGEVEREPGLAALGSATDQPHAQLGPQPLDQPARVLGIGLDRRRRSYRQPLRRGLVRHGGVPSAPAQPRACGSSRP